jgi:hypothetical protein
LTYLKKKWVTVIFRREKEESNKTFRIMVRRHIISCEGIERFEATLLIRFRMWETRTIDVDTSR